MQKTRETTEKKLFTVEEYHHMFEAGVFGEGAHVELVDGEVYEMAAVGSHHAACVKRINAFLGKLGGDFVVGVQDPVRLNDLSEPDIAVLKPKDDFYENAHPKPDDILLAVEVSDSTLAYDVDTKLPTYTRAGIPEAWIADINAKVIRVHTNPEDGEYRNILRVGREESFESKALSGAKVAAKVILG